MNNNELKNPLLVDVPMTLQADVENCGYKFPRIMQPKESYVIDYPEAIEFSTKHHEAFWSPLEISVEKDIQSIMVDCTEAERHGIVTGLRLFTKYELKVGIEHWGKVIAEMFPRPDIQRMANCFAFFELNVHAPFYNEINKVLNLATDEFYLSYTKDKTLSARMKFIDSALDSKNPLYNLGVFAMIEGGVLYSNFAYFKSFQANGKNKITNIVAGINFSVRDENIHHLGGCWLFRQAKAEMELSKVQEAQLHAMLIDAAEKIREHEHRIIDMLFEKGPISGITAHEMRIFVDSRINLCLQNLGYAEIYTVKENPIAEWFYKGITSYILHDFFARVGNQYSRGWDQSKFLWNSQKAA